MYKDKTTHKLATKNSEKMLDKVCIKFDLIDREIQSLMTDLLHYRDSEMRREVREQDGKHDDTTGRLMYITTFLYVMIFISFVLYIQFVCHK